MTVDSTSGPVTANEISSFQTYVTSLTPATDNIGNNWAQGSSGETVKAMGLMYEVSGNTAILDQMIRFCDALLAERNDLAASPTGQYTIWTGTIDPVWPNATTAPIGTGGEQGDPVGHLAYCARLILQTPAIWSTTVAIGDPNGYGASYYARAATYIAEADYTVDHHLLSAELNLANSNHLYFTSGDPYKGGLPVPWNQVMMFLYGFQNLAACHSILGDDLARTAEYDAIAKANISWFFTSGNTSGTDSDGNAIYDWGYTMPDLTKEDSDHGALDIAGFYRAYMSNRYGVTSAQLAPFGNVVCDIITITVGSSYAGTVEGSTSGSGNSAPTSYLRSGQFFTAEFRPDQYANMCAGLQLTGGSTTTAVDRFSRLMYIKNQRYLASLAALPFEAESLAVTSSGATTSTSSDPNASGGVMDFLNATATGQSATYTTSILPAGPYQLQFRYKAYPSRGQHTVAVDGAQLGGTIDQYAAAGAYPTAVVGTVTFSTAATHTVTLAVTGKNASSTAYTISADCFSFAPVATVPSFSLPAGSYSASQVVTLGSATQGASLRYTTDGSTPTTTTGTVYTGPIAISSSCTLKAIAYKTGFVASAVGSVAYAFPPSLTATNVGSEPIAGSASYASGIYTLQGCGADIYGTSDQFELGSVSASGDITLQARVATQSNTNGWAKAGVMIRSSTAANAAYVGIYLTPSNGVDMQYRSTSGGSAADIARVAAVTVPYWVKLVRSGNSFTGFCSSDGVVWTSVGSATVSMSSGVTAGLAVCSHSTTALSTATFDNLSLY